MKKIIKLSIATTLLVATNSYASSNNEDLGMITVYSATKSEQSIKDVSSNVEVISGTELDEKNISTVSDALNLVSGISFTRNGGLGKSTSVNLRGFDSKRVLVLIDGVRYNDITGTSGAPFQHLMAIDIEKIEVIKGAQSGIWGADASAGVINIITKSPKNGVHGELSTETGSFNTKKYGTKISYKEEKFYAKASYNKLSTQGFTARALQYENINQYEDDGYKNETTTLQSGIKFNDNNRLDVIHTTIDAETQTDGSLTNQVGYEFLTNDDFTSINYENKNDVATTSIMYNRSTFDREYVKPSSTTEYDGSVNEYSVKTNVNYLDDTSFFIVGVDYKTFEHTNSINKEYKNKAIFLTNNNKINNTTITESIRVDRYDTFDNKNTGKLGIKHNYTHDLFVSANVGTSYNVPTLYNLYSSSYGNANLKSESTTSYDATIGYKDLVVTYFHNIVNDMIEYDSSISKYNNIDGKSTLKGLEIAYKKEVFSDILFNISYTRLSAKDKDGEVLRRKADETLKFGIDFYGIKKLHLGINGEYVGSRYNSDNKQGAQTGKYTVANFVANYDILKNVKIYAKIDNITNKYYQTIDGYATSPRAYYAGLKYSF